MDLTQLYESSKHYVKNHENLIEIIDNLKKGSQLINNMSKEMNEAFEEFKILLDFIGHRVKIVKKEQDEWLNNLKEEANRRMGVKMD